MKLILIVAFVLLSANSPAFVTVGTDAACDLPPAQLQSAINNHANIRLTNQSTYSAVDIVNRSVVIEGGFNNCTDARAGQAGFPYSELSGNNATTVMRIATTAAAGHPHQTVVLHNLKLTQGMTSANNLAGGLDILGHLDVIMNRVDIKNNTAATHGGGMYVSGHEGAKVIMEDVTFRFNEANVGGAMVISGGAQVIITDAFISSNDATINSGGILVTSDSLLNIYNSTITANRAPQGGGIYCSGGHLYLDRDTRLSHNQANLGGGLYADNHCVGLIESGHANEPDIFEGINANTAEIQGAGIYAFNASLTLKGSDSHYVNMHGNINTNSNHSNIGGALFAYGEDSRITLINARLTNNRAQRGSAIAALNGARVTVKKQPGECFADELCSLIEGNVSSLGALYSEGCGHFEVYQTTIRHNIAGDTAVAWLTGNRNDDCHHVMEGNVIYGNRDEISETPALMHMDEKVSLDFAFNTVTDNLSDNVFRLGQTANTEQTLHLNNSIIWNAPAASINNAGNHHFSGNCLLLHDSNELPAGFGALVIGLNPEFLNAPDNDYQLSLISPPIDYCNTHLYQPKHHDILSVPRGYEMTSPVQGYFDMGAFEYDNGHHFNDVIFYDRF